MDDCQLYHISVALTTGAVCLSLLTSTIYTWVCTKTRPLRLPTVSLTALTMVFALVLGWRLYVIVVCHSPTYNYPMLWLTMSAVIVGYVLFLIGTFRDAIILDA